MRIIVLAQGQNSRWGFSVRLANVVYGFPSPYKQLLPIGDELLITRTVRMLKEKGCHSDDILVIAPSHFKKYVEGCGVISLDPVVSTLERIIQTTVFWAGRHTLILLGDVLFSHAVLDGLLASKELIFAGRLGSNQVTGKQPSELFGFSMPWKEYKSVIHCCNWAINRELGERKLRLLRELLEAPREDNLLLQLNDYTDDVDTPEEFEKYWPALRDAALEDDKKCHT